MDFSLGLILLLIDPPPFNDDDVGFIRKRITKTDDDETKCYVERENMYMFVYMTERGKKSHIYDHHKEYTIHNIYARKKQCRCMKRKYLNLLFVLK